MDGVLVIYKEKGMTSHDVVAGLRRILRRKKIGHTGTLDPEAEGVLPVLLGRATKLSDLLGGGEKVYRCDLLLGLSTDTQDIWGTVLEKKPVSVTEKEAAAAVRSFVGGYEQVPPMVSAKKVDGKKLYELAREGKEIERKAVRVEIPDIEILGIDLPRVTMRVRCSRGTYIRTLCRDIGEKLGCGGVMESLCREETGGFGLADALTLAQVQALETLGFLEERVISLSRLMKPYARFDCPEELRKAVLNGNALPAQSGTYADGELAAVYAGGEEPTGLYRFERKSGLLKPEVMFTAPEEVPRTAAVPPSVVSIGKFDGFHLGHQAILAKMREVRDEDGSRIVLFSFSDSPQAYLAGKKISNLETDAEKRRTAAGLGVGLLTELPFSERIRNMSAEEFLKEILIGRLGMKTVVAGPDCAFGYGRRGNTAFLEEHAAEYGYRLIVVDKVRLGGEVISSSRIREALSEGRMEEAAAMLGHPYILSGSVMRGKQLGRKLGIPTINQIIPPGKQFPRSGVYAARVRLEGEVFCGMANVGVKPTVAGERRPGLETHLFGFSGDVYGKTADTELLAFIRPERRFDSVDALQEQLREDREKIQKYFDFAEKTE